MTTDLERMTVEDLRAELSIHSGPFIPERTIKAFDELARRLEDAQQKIAAQEAKNNYVGRWLSAALNDPAVCEEMKDDIRLWMASDYVTLAAHDAELTAKANAEIDYLKQQNLDLMEQQARLLKWRDRNYEEQLSHDAEVAADVIKAVQSTWPVTNAREFKAWLDAKAAEYRAKAGRKE